MRTRAKAWYAGCLVLAALLACPPPATAAAPPGPGPMEYRIPQWADPDPGPWPLTGPAYGPAAEPAFGPPARPRGSPRDAVVREVNRRRTKAGCPRVRVRSPLQRAAQAHSADMAAHRRLTHTGPGGSSPAARMRAAGYPAVATGEAVASGVSTAAAAVTRWMHSRPHRAIILTCRYTDVGVGRSGGRGGPWWTLDLAARH
ncbi:CAP domain-containing protein [Streptomyces sp. NPDC006632]|uniref:CAP domain-containing protein n=1 Tax=Streptomyces sp. NPDC006632 TaxID=3157182 RepID=UPI0033A73956